jgi:large subunit ribosomal protein L17
VKEVVDGKKVTQFEEITKTVKKDSASRLNARRKMLSVLYTVTEVPESNAGKKRNTKEVNLVDKLFDEIAPKYVDRNGGYTRIIKLGQRKGDAAEEVILELV